MLKSQQNLSLDDKNFNNTIDFPNYPSTIMESKQRNYRGKAGRDWVIGNNNDNIIDGRGGHDILIGAKGNDTLSGGPGNDILNGAISEEVGRGEIDFAKGGQGKDTFILGDEYYGNYYADASNKSKFFYYPNYPIFFTKPYMPSPGFTDPVYTYPGYDPGNYWDDIIDPGNHWDDIIIDEGCLIIQDFSINNDKLQLVGSKEQYYTKEEYTEIGSSYYDGVGVYDVSTDDLICFIEDSASTPSLRSAGGGKLDLDKIAVFI